MNPAFSVIFFTTASGAGYGVLMMLGALALTGTVRPLLFFIALVPAFMLVTFGLLASLFHLGHPERAWRALSQWRSSWLAREGVVAIATYVPSGVAFAWVLFGGGGTPAWRAVAPATALLAVATVISTGMIYASLKPIPRWNNGWTVPVYLAFSVATGAMVLAPVALFVDRAAFDVAAWTACAASLVAWTLKLGYWRMIGTARPAATTGRAIGIEHLGPVRLMEGPTTGANYITREMGFQVARRHARRLRLIGGVVGGIAAPALALAGAVIPSTMAAFVVALLALFAASLGVLIERWLFFAEAEHMSMLYFGAGPG
ncbi:MAG: dimethyl sulfoxide reductase anchor subunit [Alphaproteobacteria bacterium]|nr:dimethyl sulfoxide reductase anchor subunit [Alphaproteobacteria bacterium]